MNEEAPTVGYLVTAVGALVASLTLSVLADWTAATSAIDGLTLGLLAGVGFVASTSVQQVLFEDRPVRVYLLNVGYNVVALAGVGVAVVVL